MDQKYNYMLMGILQHWLSYSTSRGPPATGAELACNPAIAGGEVITAMSSNYTSS